MAVLITYHRLVESIEKQRLAAETAALTSVVASLQAERKQESRIKTFILTTDVLRWSEESTVPAGEVERLSSRTSRMPQG